MKPLADTTKTVLILAAIIIASGALIPPAYVRYLNSREFRPPFEKALTKNIQLLDDKRNVISLSVFHGNIWLAYCSSTQEVNKLNHEKVTNLRKQFPDTEIKACIFIVDATEKEKQKLINYRKTHSAFLTDSDYIVAANIKVVQKYIKNEFRFSLLPYEKDGKWTYDHDLILLDQISEGTSTLPQAALCHMRGHFNFTKAQSLDLQLKKSEEPMIYEERLDQLLHDSVSYLLDNPNEEDPALKGGK